MSQNEINHVVLNEQELDEITGGIELLVKVGGHGFVIGTHNAGPQPEPPRAYSAGKALSLRRFAGVPVPIPRSVREIPTLPLPPPRFNMFGF